MTHRFLGIVVLFAISRLNWRLEIWIKMKETKHKNMNNTTTKVKGISCSFFLLLIYSTFLVFFVIFKNRRWDHWNMEEAEKPLKWSSINCYSTALLFFRIIIFSRNNDFCNWYAKWIFFVKCKRKDFFRSVLLLKKI